MHVQISEAAPYLDGFAAMFADAIIARDGDWLDMQVCLRAENPELAETVMQSIVLGLLPVEVEDRCELVIMAESWPQYEDRLCGQEYPLCEQ
jgi:hypothetical protein